MTLVGRCLCASPVDSLTVPSCDGSRTGEDRAEGARPEGSSVGERGTRPRLDGPRSGESRTRSEPGESSGAKSKRSIRSGRAGRDGRLDVERACARESRSRAVAGEVVVGEVGRKVLEVAGGGGRGGRGRSRAEGGGRGGSGRSWRGSELQHICSLRFAQAARRRHTLLTHQNGCKDQ